VGLCHGGSGVHIGFTLGSGVVTHVGQCITLSTTTLGDGCMHWAGGCAHVPGMLCCWGRGEGGGGGGGDAQQYALCPPARPPASLPCLPCLPSLHLHTTACLAACACRQQSAVFGAAEYACWEHSPKGPTAPHDNHPGGHAQELQQVGVSSEHSSRPCPIACWCWCPAACILQYQSTCSMVPLNVQQFAAAD
jgi:hypothetical protein